MAMEDPGELAVAAIISNPIGGQPFEKQHPLPDAGLIKENVDDDDPLLPVSDQSPLLGHPPLESLPTFYASIRLLPLLAVFCTGWGMSFPLFVEMIKDRVCSVGFELAANTCSHINQDQFKSEGDLVRSRTADYQLYDTLISSIPAIFFSLFVGAWSDRFGRRMPMLLPLVGLTLSNGYVALIANFPDLGPGFMLVASVLGTITGGWSILLMAMFSYIGDHSTSKNRSVNVVIIDCGMGLFVNAGSYLGGYLNGVLGPVIPFYLITGSSILSLAYVAIFIHDRPKPKSASHPTGFRGLFTVDNIKDNIHMLKKKRLGDTRLHLWMIFLALTAYNLIISGDATVFQIFAEFAPIRWTLSQYTEWSAICGFLNGALSMGLMLVLRKYFHVADTLVGFLAVLSAILSYFVYGIAWSGWMLYMGAFLGMLRVLIWVSVRSLMSTLVDASEIGKSMSLISSMQSITPMIGAAIYTNLFARTSSWMPGLCFLAASFSLVPVLAAMGYVDVMRRKDVYREDYKYKPLNP